MRLTTTLLVACLLISCDGDPPPDAGLVDSGPRRDAGTDAGPAPDDSPYKGPWAHQPSTTEMRVRWESRLEPATVELAVELEAGGPTLSFTGVSRETVVQLSYGIGSPIVSEPDVPGTYYVNEVDMSGLDPGACYLYSIVGYPEEGGRFCTLHASDDHATPIRFYAIGDTSPGVMHTVPLIEAARPELTDFTIHLGDIQYYETLIESQQLWFGLMEPLLRANAFLPSVGNHEIDEVPHEYADIYQRLLTPAGRNGDDRWYSFESGGVWFFSLSSEHDLTVDSEQLMWLEAQLATAEADPDYRFSVIYMHRPLYTLGDFEPRQSMRDALFPLLAAHRIPLVLAGHVHAYQRFEYPDTTHVVAGSGGFVDLSVDQHVADYPDDAMHRVASGVFHASMVIEITENTDGNDVIHGEAIDEEGGVRDSFDRIVMRP